MSRQERPPRRRGQSLVEFALILPILLTMVGAAIDFARVYQGWITLEGATRDAAEYAATFTKNSSTATTEATRVVCSQTQLLSGFSGNATTCNPPAVTVTFATPDTTAASGGSSLHPVQKVTVVATLPFRTFFAYPLFTQNGAWTLTSTQSFSIIQDRN